MVQADLKEPTFGQDDYRRPNILENTEVVIQSILMVLFGKPGCFPSIPELGMNIQQYRVSRFDSDDVENIKAQLSYQCALIRESVITDDITVKYAQVKGKYVLFIAIPVSTANDPKSVLIGISEGEDGNAVYNYKLINEMLML
jgi:hypothetical protein